MPVPELMTWEPKTRRWTRTHKGKRFWVSCRQLATAETKEASLHAANEWWRAKQAEIDGAGRPSPRPPQPMEDIAAASFGLSPADFFERLLAMWGKWQASPVEAQGAAERDHREIIQNAVGAFLQQCLIEGKPLPEGLVEQLPPARVEQIAAAVKGLRGEPSAPPDRRV